MFKCRQPAVAGALLIVLAAAATAMAQPKDPAFKLAGFVPNDVFLFSAQRHNPERAFLDRYWDEVFDAFRQTGIDKDLTELLGTLLGVKERAELERLRDRMLQLVQGVPWARLTSGETAFSERFAAPWAGETGRPPVLIADVLIADLVWLTRTDAATAAEGYSGLVALLEGVIAEINQLLGNQALATEKLKQNGADLTSVNLLAALTAAPSLHISVAVREDVVLVALGSRLRDDVLGLLDGRKDKTPLSADPRFRSAFATLPPAEDEMIFFDLPALVKPLRAMLDSVFEQAGPGDLYVNTGRNSAATRLNGRAMAAYQKGDIAAALDFTQQAYAAAPDDSIVLYNLACFHALLGHRDEALGWLEKAVAGGFYAPAKIAGDPDLKDLRNEPKYQAALVQATQRLAESRAVDVIVNSTKVGEHFTLSMQALQAYEQKDFERGLRLMEQAYAVAPQDSRVLYGLACFHALLGHTDKALDFLEQSVAGGYYCPQHIMKDPDLQSIRTHERYRTALEAAQKAAARAGGTQVASETMLWKNVLDRIGDAVGIIDYSASVERTDGFDVYKESLTNLAADAPGRPIYAVFGQRGPLTDFDRFLPQETASFSAHQGIDPKALHRFLLDTVRKSGTVGEELLAGWTRIQSELGIDLERDLLAWLNGRIITMTLADARGSVWLIKVDDETLARDKVRQGLSAAAAKLAALATANPAAAMLGSLAPMTSPADDERLPGFDALQFPFSPQPVVWGVTEGYLIVGTSADAAALCLATARGTHPNLRSNARLMRAALMPDGPCVSVTFTDWHGWSEEVGKVFGFLSMGITMAGNTAGDPALRSGLTRLGGLVAKLNPVVRKIDFYDSTATVTTFDGKCSRTRQVTHFVPPDKRPARSTDQPAP